MKPKSFLGVIVLLLIFLVPSSFSISTFKWLEGVASRIESPVTADEQLELDFLSCMERVSESIPSRTNVFIDVPDGNSYFVQRAQDVLYPRLRLVAENPDYIFRVNPMAPSTHANKLLTSENCSGVLIEVENAS